MALNNPVTAGEIVATTLRNRTGKAADNVTKNTALLNRLRRKGNVDPVDGGRTIMQELEYAENGTYKRYSGYEALNIAPSDVFTYAEFNYAQAAVAVSMSGLEMIQNSGEAASIKLLAGRIKNAERTMQNNISGDIYSDGTADGGRQVNGLQALVADTNTNTVGGINASTYTFWQNKLYRSVTDGGAAATSANILSYMNRLWVQLVRGNDKVDLIPADNNYYRLYMESLQSIQRIASDEMAQAGFESLKYMTADVVLDGGFGGGCPTNHMYMLNTNYIFFRPAASRNFVPLGDDRYAVNQDAMVKLIGFAGNLTTSNRFLQGNLNGN